MYSKKYHRLFYHVTGDFTRDGNRVIHLVNHPVRISLLEAESPKTPDYRQFVEYDEKDQARILYTVRLDSIK